MSRRLVIPLLVVTLVVAALVSVAAVTTTSTPVVQVTPLVHREGNDGYPAQVTGGAAGESWHNSC